VLSLAAWLGASAMLVAQVTADQQADMLLQSGRKAYNEKNYAFAATRFREFLTKFGGHKDAPAVRYGLALALVEIYPPNYNEIRDLLQTLTGAKDFDAYPLILYHLGMAMRGQGVNDLATAEAKPAEAAKLRASAQQRFEEARQQFAATQAAFEARVKNVKPDVKELPADLESAILSRCNQAEMLLRLLKTKEAQALTLPFLKDPILEKSQYRDQGRYYHGFAHFLLKDYPAAERTLTMVAPFSDPVWGTHARYLLARTHHLQQERPEATANYQGVVNDHAANVKNALAILKQPAKLKDYPAEKARLEELVKHMPDHVLRATFYLGVLQYETGKFGDAKGHFAAFAKSHPESPLRFEAELRLGFCQVQLKEFADAKKTLEPLVDKDKRLSDQVLFWLGKAQAGSAPDPSKVTEHNKALESALATFRQAADRAQALVASDPEAKERRGEILMEMADTHQLLKQTKEATGIYTGLLADKVLPQREEEITQRLVTTLHLGGDYNGADKAALGFVEKFPKSTLLPEIMFRYAENSYFRTLAAEKDTKLPDRAKVVADLRAETIKRLDQFIAKFPEYSQINLARFSLGLTYYHMGDLEKARTALANIAGPDRSGELAVVPYIMADCLLRTAPTTVPEDALAVGKLEDQLKTAAELLDSFVSAGSGPLTADALLKLGLCQQRRAALQGQPKERNALLQTARAVYERMMKQFKNDPLQPQAMLERAKCIAQLGDIGQAVNELRKFTNDPLKNTSVAPMAVLQLTTLLRAQNNAKEALNVMARSREYYEPILAKDPARAEWVSLLRYHHGVALREAGNLAEARAVFGLVLKDAPNRPEAAEAALRLGQCLKDEGQQRIELSYKIQAKPKSEAEAQKVRAEGLNMIRQAVAHFETQAEDWKKRNPALEARARMLYEAAWGYRKLAEAEIDAARTAMAQEIVKKLGPAAEKFPPPQVPLVKVPFQPQEKKAHASYQALVAAFPDLPLATDARFELAELLSDRAQYDQAVALLNEGLDREPPQDLTERIRLRIGAIHAAKGNIKGALAQFDAVALNVKSPHLGQAHYRAGEAFIDAKQFDQAVKRLSVFQTQGQLQNIPGLSDRAFLRLGHAWANLQNWDESRKALERLVNQFPQSPWADEGRYSLGYAVQQLKQYDQAINHYSQVVNRTATETAAKAQLQIGICKLEQKKFQEAANALLVVPFTYDYPDVSAAALVEAARAFVELKQTEQAIRLLERVVRDHGQSPWADAARERLKELKKEEGK
jgi:TolA-binding protein